MLFCLKKKNYIRNGGLIFSLLLCILFTNLPIYHPQLYFQNITDDVSAQNRFS